MKLALMIDVPETIPDESYVRVPGGSFEETLSLAAEIGFDGVELLVDHPERARFEGLPQALAQTGLTVAAINSGRLYFDYGLELITSDPKGQKAGRDALLALAYQTAPFQAPINIGVIRGLPAEVDTATARERLVTILQNTADQITAVGASLILEPSNRQEFPFITSTADGLALVKLIDRPNVSLMLDTFHMSLENESFVDSFTMAIPVLRHIHFLDRLRNPPSTSSDEFDFDGVLQVLHEHNYDHYLSMPMLRNGDIAATTEIITALKTAIKIL